MAKSNAPHRVRGFVGGYFLGLPRQCFLTLTGLLGDFLLAIVTSSRKTA